MDIAEALRRQLESVEADVVQLDEAYIAGHPRHRLGRRGPSTMRSTACLNETAVHICFGNYGGQTVQPGDSGATSSRF